MVFSTGVDLVYIPRFKNTIKKTDRTFLSKVFHPSELKNMDLEHLAGIFAAKEAVMKALELQPGNWLEIEIRYKLNGRPFVEVSERLEKKIKDISVGISHDKDYAIASCVASIIKDDKE